MLYNGEEIKTDTGVAELEEQRVSGGSKSGTGRG